MLECVGQTDPYSLIRFLLYMSRIKVGAATNDDLFFCLFLKMTVNLGREGFASCGSDGLVVLWKVRSVV